MTVKPEQASTLGTPPKRRGRPRLPDDNATRERLLQAAQTLFSERSFTQVGIREITDAAGMAVSSVNYHFGSKDGLLSALFVRHAPALLRDRAELLRAAEALEAPTEAKLAAIMHALLAPVIRWARHCETQRWFVPFLARIRLDGPPELQRLAEEATLHLQPFQNALQRLFPQRSEAEIGWRLHFVLGIEHSLLMEAARLRQLTDGESLSESDESVIQRVVDFVCPGWLA